VLSFAAVAVALFVGYHDDHDEILVAVGAVVAGFLVAVPYFVAAAILKLLRTTTNTLYRVEWWLSFTAQQLRDPTD
jgi:chromate transport protein ChrA